MKVAVAAVLLLWSSTACAEERAPVAATARECLPEIRLDGVTYTAAGYTEIRGTRFDTADAADCDDRGPSPRGSVFTGHSEQVDVWSLPGYSTDEVVAARFNDDSFTIFVADSMPRGEIDRVVRELSPTRG